MVGVNNRLWKPLEQMYPALFLIGGGLILGHAAIRGVEAFTNVAPPPDIFAPAGYLLATLGLLGVYPVLAKETPAIARIAASVALVPLLGWMVIFLAAMAEILGLIASPSVVIPGAFYGVHLGAFTVAYLLFGLASLLGNRHSQTISALLLAPPLLFIVMVVIAAIAGDSAVGAFLVGAGLAVAHLAIGLTLRNANARTDHDTPAGDLTTG